MFNKRGLLSKCFMMIVVASVFGFLPSLALAKGAGEGPPLGSILESPTVIADFKIKVNKAGTGWDWWLDGKCGVPGNLESTQKFVIQGVRPADVVNTIAGFQAATASEVAASFDGQLVEWPLASAPPCSNGINFPPKWVMFINRVITKVADQMNADVVLVNYKLGF